MSYLVDFIKTIQFRRSISRFQSFPAELGAAGAGPKHGKTAVRLGRIARFQSFPAELGAVPQLMPGHFQSFVFSSS
uniref:Uncharacterized protein n=1 Tax=Arundo donax TaxID=35708 RepID=A0A0A8ZFS4_ARUDO